MATTSKNTQNAKQGKVQNATKTKTGAKKPAASIDTSQRKSTEAIVSQSVPLKKAPPSKKASLSKTTTKMVASRTNNPRSTTTTIKKITRNIVQFHMTEEIEIRRVTKSDNISKEKLTAKYARLKAKVKS